MKSFLCENPGKIILGASLTADHAIVVTTASGRCKLRIKTPVWNKTENTENRIWSLDSKFSTRKIKIMARFFKSQNWKKKPRKGQSVITNEVVDPAADLSKGLNAFVMLSNYNITKERSTKGLVVVGYMLC